MSDIEYVSIDRDELKRLREDSARYLFLRDQGLKLEGHDFLSFGKIANDRIDDKMRDPVAELLEALEKAHAGHMVGHDQSDQPRGGYSEGYVNGFGACIESARRVLSVKS